MKLKKIIYILAAGLIFAGCSNLIDDPTPNLIDNTILQPESSSTSSQAGESQEKAVLKISMGENSARTALPEISKKDLIYLTLRYAEKYNDKTKDTPDEVCVGDWKSVAEMTSSTLAFRTGTFTFRFYVMSKGGAVFGDEQTYTITPGVNNLTFSPTLESFLTDFSGKGNLSIEMRYNTKNVKKVTAGLYSTSGNSIPGFNDEDLTSTTSGFINYNKTDIYSGNYIAIFKFWADDEKTQLLGTYREYASIVQGLTSSSECVVNELGNLFSITYECNGGIFVENYTAHGSYTRQSANLDLPQGDKITLPGYDFGGWFTSPDFSGSQLTFIPSGTTGNLVLYARWIPKITIMYSPNGGSIKTTTQVVTPDSDGTVTLSTPAELGLNPPKPGKIFLGWARTATTVIPPDEINSDTTYDLTLLSDSNDTTPRAQYIIYKKNEGGTITEGAKIKANESLVLYAIWSYSDINPVEGNPNAETSLLDNDGDGLTDWEEVFKYHTDPMSIDTDGDGWTDKQELSMYNAESKYFSPLIADTPFIDVVFDQKPVIEYVYKLTEGKTVTEIQSTSEGQIGSRSATATNTKTFNMTHNWKLGMTIKHSTTETDGTTAGQATHHTATTSGLDIAGEVGGSYSSGDTYTYSTTDSQSWSKSWQNGRNITDSKGKSIEGGKIRIPVKLKNQTQVGYTIKSITIAVNRLAYGKPTEKVPVGSYTSTAPMTLRPNSESGQINIELNLTVGETEQLLKYSNTIFVEISGFQVTTFKDSQTGNNDFTEALTEVRAKTASIYIDCGPGSSRKPRTYNVAVKNKLNTNGTSMNDQYQPVKLKEIFDEILELKENYAGSTAGYEIYQTAPGKGLKSIYGITNSNTQKNGNWYIEHKTIKNGLIKETLYSHFFDGGINNEWNFEDIEVHAGDEITIFYSVDRDEDNLPLAKELIYGTSDAKKDTDGDYLKDFDEIYGWYQTGLQKEAYMTELGHHEYADNAEDKVYSNPVLKDTDGDGKNDYKDADYPNGAVDDPDPINSEQKNNKSLKPLAYYQTSLTGKKYELKMPTEGGDTEDYAVSQTNTISISEDTIFLDISPSHPYSRLEYYTEIVENSQTTPKWLELKAETPHKLLVGENIIKLRCWNTAYAQEDNAPDKYYYWNVKVTSLLKNFSGLRAETDDNSNGEVRLTWNTYSDLRCTSSDGGYVLYCRQSNSEPDNLDSYVNRSKLILADDKKTDLNIKDEFFLKLSKDEIESKVGVTLQLAPQKTYWFYLYGYAHNGEENTYFQQRLGSTNITTKKSTKGILCFYAHYIEDIEDCDGSSDPNYYWNFTCNNPNMKFSGCSLLRELTKDWDVDDEGEAKYCTLGGNSFGYYDYQSKPLKFGDGTRKIMCEFDRNSANNNFTVQWTVNEKDGGYDDTLGTVTAYFKYNRDNDTWTCEWQEGNGALPWSSSPFCQGNSSTIAAGEKTDFNIDGSFSWGWWLRNDSYGSVVLRWDWSWDVETKEELQKNQGK